MAGSLTQVINDDNDNIKIWDCGGCVEGLLSSGGGRIVSTAE